MKAASLVISVLLLGLTGAAVHAEPVSSVSGAADQAARQVAEAFKPLWGTILSSLPNSRYLVDVTAETGAYVGMELEVFREGEPFKHPVTGEVLGRMDRPVGIVRLVEVQNQFSVAELVQLHEGEKCQQGDGVRVSKARVLAGLADISSLAIDERQGRTLNREIEAALLKTGRFEVMDERMMRSTLTKEQIADTTPLTDPGVLEILRKDLRLHAVIFPVVRTAEGGVNVELKVVSTFTGRPLYLASAEVRMAAAASTASEQQSTASAQPPPASQTPLAAPPPGVAPVPEDAPVPAWLGPPRDRSQDKFLGVPYMGIPSTHLVLGPEFDGVIRGVAVADLNGDGRKEVAVATEDRITIYAVEGKAFRRIWTSEGQSYEGYSNIMALDAADINGNGVAEIFVSSYFGDAPGSFVLEFEKGEWVPTWTNVDLFFRVLPDSQGRPVLYAQRVGREEMFPGGVKTYVAEDGHYEPQSEPKLPRGTYIYNFAIGDVQNSGKGGGKQIVQISDSRTLRLWSDGKLKSEPSESFGGGNSLAFRPATLTNSMSYEAGSVEGKRYTMHPRLVITDVDGDGKRELVAVRNIEGATKIFENLVLYDKSKIVALQWAPTGFQIVWETPDLEGYVTDIFFGDLGDGGDRVLIFALVRPEKLGLAGATSGLFVYRLVPGGPQPQGPQPPQLGRVSN